MMNTPLISVIIPVYTGSFMLERAIQSALCQDMDLEILVINDCSPEDVDTVMVPYAQDPRILYLKNDKNLGAAESRNRGVWHARGKYIAFLDADDSWLPGKLQKQYTILEETGAVLCATGRELVKRSGESTGRTIGMPKTVTYRDLMKHNCISCSSVVMKREVALEFPMHHAQDSHEDYIMWLEILQKYGVAKGIDEPLLRYTISDQGKSGSKWKSAGMTLRVYRHMGFGPIKSAFCFCSYALHGVWKHYCSPKHHQ